MLKDADGGIAINNEQMANLSQNRPKPDTKRSRFKSKTTLFASADTNKLESPIKAPLLETNKQSLDLYENIQPET